MFKNIVVPVDLSDKQSVKVVFPVALNFVNAFGSKIHLVHIMPDFGMKMVSDYLPRHWMSDQKEKYNKLFLSFWKRLVKVSFRFALGLPFLFTTPSACTSVV